MEATGESNRIITQAMRMKQSELEAINIKYDALKKQMMSLTETDESDESKANHTEVEEAGIDEVKLLFNMSSPFSNRG
jgi:hypothetical protein